MDVEVKLRSGCRDIMLQGKEAVVKHISGKIATVKIRDNSSDLTIPHESLVPVPPRRSDMVKVIGGNESVLGLIGTLVSQIGDEGIVQFMSYNRQRQRNPAQIPLAQLGRYTPLSKFSSRPSPPVGLFSPSNSGEGGDRELDGVVTSTTSEGNQLMYRLVALPTQHVFANNHSSTSLQSSSGTTISIPAMSPHSSTSNHYRQSLNMASSGAERLPINVSSMQSSNPSKNRAYANFSLRGGDDGGDERDSAVIFPRHTRPSSASSPVTSATNNAITSGKAWPPGTAKDLYQSRNSNSLQRMDKPTGQVFTFPVKNFAPDPRLQLLLNQRNFSGVVSRGGGSASSNGYVLSEVLEKLVKNQKSYRHELTSPSTPGEDSLITEFFQSIGNNPAFVYIN